MIFTLFNVLGQIGGSDPLNPDYTLGIQPSCVQEGIPGGVFFVIAYIAIWIIVLFYVFILARRIKRLFEDIDELKGRIGGKDQTG